MRFFSIRKILAILFAFNPLIQVDGQVPSEYEGAGSVKFIRFSIATPNYFTQVYQLNLYYDGLSIWDVYKHGSFEDEFLYFKSDKVVENYSFQNSFGLQYGYYKDDTHYSGEVQNEYIKGNDIYYHNGDFTDFKPTNSYPPVFSFCQINTPLIYLNETSAKRYFCESENIDLEVLTKNTDFSGKSYSSLDAPFLGASLQVALASEVDAEWITIKEDLIPGSISIPSSYIRDEWYGRELKFRIRQHMRTIPYQCIFLGMVGVNNEASIESSLPDYYSEPISGFYFLEEPDNITFSYEEPTCYEDEAAAVTINGLPASYSPKPVRIDFIVLSEESSGADSIYVGTNYYWTDQKTRIDNISPGQTSFEFSSNDVDISLKNGPYGIKFYYDTGLCPAIDNFYINAPDPLTLKLTPFEAVDGSGYHTKEPGGTGSVTIQTSGGREEASYEYKINNEGFQEFEGNSCEVSGLSNGDTITLSNTDTCDEVFKEVVFNEPETLTISYGTLQYPDCDDTDALKPNSSHSNGQIPYNVSGGISPYRVTLKKKKQDGTFSAIQESTSSYDEFSGLTNGTYQLKVVDAGGTDTSEEIDLTRDAIKVSLKDSSPKLDCNGNSYSVVLEGDSVTSSSLYYKEASDSNFSSFTNGDLALVGGSYDIKVANDKCFHVHNLTVNEPGELQINTVTTPDICELNNGTLSVTISGGRGDRPFSITLNRKKHSGIWKQSIPANSPNKTFTFSNLPAGDDYKVIVTNGPLCSKEFLKITIPETNPLNALEIIQTRNASCSAVNDATLNVNNIHLIEDPYKLTINGAEYSLNDENEITNLFSSDSAIVKITESGTRGCLFKDTINIELIQDTLNFSNDSLIQDASCKTASNGSIKVLGEGGRGDELQYKLGSNSYSNDSLFTGKSPGVYKVSIKDTAGCVVSQDFTVGASENPITIGSILSEPASCQTSEDGSIVLENISHDGGLGLTLSYQEGDVDITSGNNFTYSNIGSGDYSFTLLDNQNCSVDTTITLSDNGYTPVFSHSVVEEVACTGKSNGRVLIDAQGLVDDYSYKLFSEANLTGELIKSGTVSDVGSFVVDNLPENTGYSIEVEDRIGCIGIIESFEMPVSDNSLQIFTAASPASCNEVTNGELEVNASGGFPYEDGTYLFSYEKNSSGNFETQRGNNLNLESLAVGDEVEVSVEDKYGCNTSDFEIIQIKDTVTQILGVESTNPACYGAASGAVELKMRWTPSSLDYNYALFKQGDDFSYSDTISDVIDENYPIITNLSGGNYDLQITDSDGCSDIYPGLNLVDPDSMRVGVSHNYIKVKDESTGEFQIDITGGNEKYEVGWAALPDDNALDNIIITTDSEFSKSELPAGTYMLAVRDTANCPYFDGEAWFTQEIEIIEPQLALGMATEHVEDVSCNKLSDGRIEVQAQGGWGPYTYALDGGAPESDGMFEDLKAGTYSVLVTDTAGVTFETSYQVTEPDTLNLFIDLLKDATCPGFANGLIEATTLNGIDEGNGLDYHIENTADRSIVSGNFYDDRNYRFNRLAKGQYELFVKDANQCIASKEFSIGEPDTAVIALQKNYIRARGASTGEISSSIYQGNGVFDYKWFKSDTEVPFEEGRTTGQLQLDSLLAGVYTLMVRDTAGCVYEDEEWMVRNIIIEEPDTALNFEVTHNQSVSCYSLEDGWFNIQPYGGWGDYQIRLDDEHYSGNGHFENLDAGDYAITVRDSSGIEFTKVVAVSEPDTLKADLLEKSDVACYGGNDGALVLNVTGGNLSYLVSLDGGENWIQGTSVESLPAGKYVPHIKDTLGCSIVIDSVFINQPGQITLLNDSIIKSRCSNNEGGIFATYGGGVGAFNYTWYRDLQNSEGVNEQQLMVDESGPNIDSLFSGGYYVVVKDEHQCEMPFEFFVDDITDLTIDSVVTTDVWCWGYSDGEAEVSVSKGNPPYHYTWSQAIANTVGPLASNISAGEYQVLVSDSKGCKTKKAFTIGTPAKLSIDTTSFQHPLCLGGYGGMVEVKGKGGIPGYYYQWNEGTSGNTIEELNPGLYELTLVDNHNCEASFAFELDYQRTLRPNIGNDTTICHYDVLTLDGGAYSAYSWRNNEGIFSDLRAVEVNDPGKYYLTVEDIDHCLGFDTISVSQSILEISNLNVTDVTCANAADGQAAISINSNEDTYKIIWPDGSDNTTWSGLSGGEYLLSVKNPRGCEDEQSFVVDEPDPLSLTATVSNPLCYGVFSGRIEVVPEGGNGGYQLDWSTGVHSEELKALDQGTYSLTVTDSKKCSITDVYELFYERTLLPDLGDDLVLCSEAAGFLSPGNFYRYRWLLEGQELAPDSVYEVSSPGNYVVEVSDRDNCLAYDTVTVTERESDLKPEFLMATSVPSGDTLMIVDVTTPKPSSLDWSFTGDYEVVANGDYFCEVVFKKEGMQLITLSAMMETCMGQMQKQILVTPESPKSDGREQDGDYSSVFKNLTVSPNPTDGDFLVEIELKETSSVNLYLVRLDTGQIFEKDRLTGMKTYTRRYNVSGSGQYVVFAESGGERLMQKVMVF